MPKPPPSAPKPLPATPVVNTDARFGRACLEGVKIVVFLVALLCAPLFKNVFQHHD